MANRPAGGPPPFGLNLLMGATTGMKVKTMMMNMQDDRMKVIQGVTVLSG